MTYAEMFGCDGCNNKSKCFHVRLYEMIERPDGALGDVVTTCENYVPLAMPIEFKRLESGGLSIVMSDGTKRIEPSLAPIGVTFLPNGISITLTDTTQRVPDYEITLKQSVSESKFEQKDK